VVKEKAVSLEEPTVTVVQMHQVAEAALEVQEDF
jgi:NACalpha-BTF3-like transcription factor